MLVNSAHPQRVARFARSTSKIWTTARTVQWPDEVETPNLGILLGLTWGRRRRRSGAGNGVLRLVLKGYASLFRGRALRQGFEAVLNERLPFKRS